MLDCINIIVMPHSYKNNKDWELCCLPRRQSWCQAAPGRLPGRRWTWLQKQSFLDLASENGEKGFCEWRRFSHRLRMKGRQMQRKAECCTDLTAWVSYRGKLNDSLVKMRGVTLISSSNYASLTSLTEEFWFFDRNFGILRVLQKFAIFHLEVLQCFLKLLLIDSMLLLLSSLPKD